MRFIEVLIGVVLTFSSLSALGISCELAELMSHPAVRDNAEFWQEFGAHGEISDDALRSLYRKHGVESEAAERRVVERAETAAHASTGGPQFTFSKQAIKDSRNLQPSLKRNLDEFLGYAKDGGGHLSQELMKNGGKWNYKKLDMFREPTYSARLDIGTRVVFRQSKDGVVDIIAIDNSTTH